MRALHALATSYSQRPSRIVGIRDRVAAYQFDLSVMVIAMQNDEPEKALGDVRTLAGGPVRRIQIPANGVW